MVCLGSWIRTETRKEAPRLYRSKSPRQFKCWGSSVVERLPSKQDVEGSNPSPRSKHPGCYMPSRSELTDIAKRTLLEWAIIPSRNKAVMVLSRLGNGRSLTAFATQSSVYRDRPNVIGSPQCGNRHIIPTLGHPSVGAVQRLHLWKHQKAQLFSQNLKISLDIYNLLCYSANYKSKNKVWLNFPSFH
jgi:hypothetical protein